MALYLQHVSIIARHIIIPVWTGPKSFPNQMLLTPVDMLIDASAAVKRPDLGWV